MARAAKKPRPSKPSEFAMAAKQKAHREDLHKFISGMVLGELYRAFVRRRLRGSRIVLFASAALAFIPRVRAYRLLRQQQDEMLQQWAGALFQSSSAFAPSPPPSAPEPAPPVA